MKLKFRGDKLLVGQALKSKAELRLSSLLGRFGDEVGSVVFHLSKVAAVGGRAAKRCQITVGRKPNGVRVEHTDASLLVALERAADKAVRSVARVLDHERGAFGVKPLRMR
jgi:ribosomal subunit interface protein